MDNIKSIPVPSLFKILFVPITYKILFLSQSTTTYFVSKDEYQSPQGLPRVPESHDCHSIS